MIIILMEVGLLKVWRVNGENSGAGVVGFNIVLSRKYLEENVGKCKNYLFRAGIPGNTPTHSLKLLLYNYNCNDWTVYVDML